MKKLRRWFNNPNKEIQEIKKEPVPRPSTPETTHCFDDVSVAMEMPCSTLPNLAALLLDLRDVDAGSKTEGADADLIQSTRLSMLRELLHGDITTAGSTWSSQTSIPLPVSNKRKQGQQGGCDRLGEQIEQGEQEELQEQEYQGGQEDHGEEGEQGDQGEWMTVGPARTRATDTASHLGLPVFPLLKTRDICSLPSSPLLLSPGGRRRRQPCSLPCSPLLGGRHQTSSSSTSTTSTPSSQSRLWVEAALQRSKNIRQAESCTSLPCSPAWGRHGQRVMMQSSWGETEEEEEEDKWSEEDKQVNTARISLSDNIVFTPLTSDGVCVGEDEEEKEDEVEEKEEEEEEEEEVSYQLCLDSEISRYCLLSPCICFRCPSAPPYEDGLFSPRDPTHRSGLNPLSHMTDTQKPDIQGTEDQKKEGGLEQSLHSGLYPSLSQWRITADCQTEVYMQQEEEEDSDPDSTTRFHDNHQQELSDIPSGEHVLKARTGLHLSSPIPARPGAPGDLQTLCSLDLSFVLKKVLDSTTCSNRTARPENSCSFCLDTCSIMKRLCTTCQQVFCSRCLCHFVSLLQIHQLSQPAGYLFHTGVTTN